ncbi:phosphoanhydride phosphorylase [Kosakonia radicincitans DSM 16656]|uniref:AppA family phytase/histidine-type acid phosphatase n=1 Tax=Kosakonia radicincitans TaxID=283686 RepID=UPI000272F583|nr:AppA family phytase/histidine-type acid phosphatase [Kosakonia radicincitans]APG18247.1 phosphoanhydride phosphorylase [Kosakonia radicincitans]ARD60663.1 phosphoanhydride phosphorylase [Kosakonia radicincitans DSM 16656]QEM91469.1 AppA family phytase/histidine-type acid phosphatase [Kosakonia radicincitans]SKC21744.1 4-phytase / acid phosphatase [Kosakonia radicincitans]
MNTLIVRFIFLTLIFGSVPALASGKSEMKLERVVILSRHGVRAPTKSTALMQAVTPYQWPQWDVPLGWLTPRGGQLISELGKYQRLRLAEKGLQGDKTCPFAQVAVVADTDQRTRKTGEAFLAGFAPECHIPVHYQQQQTRTDPVFNPIKAGKCSFNPVKVKEAILNQAGGDIGHYAQRYQPAFQTLEKVLNFSQSEKCKATGQNNGCSLTQVLPTKLNATPDNVSLTGAWGLSSMLTEIFLLQQAQGMPQVAWGRIAGEKEWGELLSLHNAQFDLLQKTPEVARSKATPLLDLIRTALVTKGSAENSYGINLPVSLLFIAGHDTNLANISGALGINWLLPAQPDNTPPGGELVFERWKRLSDNSDWIQVSFVYQTLQEMREMQPLSLENPPGQVDLKLTACNEKNAQGMCSLASFSALIESVRVPACGL